MAKISLKEVASDVANLLGETLSPAGLTEESPFPNIENRVRILAPGILSDLIREMADKQSYIEVSGEIYPELLQRLKETFSPI